MESPLSSSFSARLYNGCRKIFFPLIPPLCPLCQMPVSADETLCPRCWKSLEFITDPTCHGCGAPLDYGTQAPLLCGLCRKDPFPFQHAKAILKYTPASRPLVLKLKYADATHLIPLFAQWMIHRMQQDPLFTDGINAIIPVPLHWSRLLNRGFNQAALLTRALTHHFLLPHWPRILERTWATPPQGSASKEKRKVTLAKAFRVSPSHKPLIQGKTFLLVDDVMASGATLRFCANTLLTEGAAAVKVLVLCRSLF